MIKRALFALALCAVAAPAPAAFVTFAVNGPPAPISGPESLFSPSAVPSTPNYSVGWGDTEQGVQFKSAVAGYVTGIRFYKGTANTGTHVGSLWTASGTLLASATFANETASGWQEVDFTFAVPIAAGTTYVASYHSSAHSYSGDAGWFTSNVVNGDLTALASGNGVFVANGNAPQFPNGQGNFAATNYWVDVVFNRVATSPPATTTYPTIGAQVPHLLDGYAYKPGWSVAGVNYGVGVPDGQVLTNPALISTAGVSINTATRVVTVSGNNVTLDSYDFTLGGGWAVNITGANTTISNSNFLAMADGSHTPIYANGSAGSFTVTHCTIDGQGLDPGNFILMQGTGTVTVDHSWLKNANGDIIDMNTGSAGPINLIAQYNLFQNAGMSSGAHGDLIQFLGNGPITATITYNTTTEPSGGSTQGFMVEPDVGASLGVIAGGEIGHNTFTGYTTAFTGITIADLTGTFTVDNNYFDPTNTSFGLAFGGSRGGVGDGNAFSVYTANINMVSGAVYGD